MIIIQATLTKICQKSQHNINDSKHDRCCKDIDCFSIHDSFGRQCKFFDININYQQRLKIQIKNAINNKTKLDSIDGAIFTTLIDSYAIVMQNLISSYNNMNTLSRATLSLVCDDEQVTCKSKCCCSSYKSEYSQYCFTIKESLNAAKTLLDKIDQHQKISIEIGQCLQDAGNQINPPIDTT